MFIYVLCFNLPFNTCKIVNLNDYFRNNYACLFKIKHFPTKQNTKLNLNFFTLNPCDKILHNLFIIPTPQLCFSALKTTIRYWNVANLSAGYRTCKYISQVLVQRFRLSHVFSTVYPAHYLLSCILIECIM